MEIFDSLSQCEDRRISSFRLTLLVYVKSLKVSNLKQKIKRKLAALKSPHA